MVASIEFEESFNYSIEVYENTVVSLDNLNDTGVLGWQWSLVVPPGSSAVIADPNAQSTEFTADVPGTYLVKLVTYVDADRNVVDGEDQKGVGVRFGSVYPWRIPVVGETSEFDSERGYSDALYEIFKDCHDALVSFDSRLTALEP